jgi:ribonuclease HI
MSEETSGALPAVTLYTDGGADPNPGPGGWGAVLVHPASGRREELRGGEPHSTNNRMELTAAIEGLDALLQPCQVELFTDSQYLRRGITEWLPGWIARGWRRKDGVLLNEDLWRRLAAATARHQIRWKWVKGHAGHTHNERADQLATAAIREQRAAARPAAPSPGTATGPAPAAPPLPEIDVYLRISFSKQGAGWAALVRRTAPEGGAAGAAGPGALADVPTAPAEAGAPSESMQSGGLPRGMAKTSNALDLVSAATVLESLPPGVSVAVHTASDYLRYGASRWLPAWRQRGWKTKEGGAVLNRELWQRLATAMAARRVEWPEVKGREIEEFERLGPLARAAAIAPPKAS